MTIDRSIEANIRLDRIINFVRIEPVGSFRTHLDEWAAYHFGGGLLNSNGKQRWFNNPCPWIDGERLLTHMDWLSFEAAEICRRGIRKDAAVRKPQRGQPAPYRLIVEHVVPIRVLREEIRADQALWQKSKLIDFLRYHFKRAVVTKKQDTQLGPLKQSMPEGWVAGNDPFARYRAVGLLSHGSFRVS